MRPEPRYRVPEAVLRDTFAELRRCGAGQRECQVLWTGPWAQPETVTTLMHPLHRACGDGFELDGAWLTAFWQQLVALALFATVILALASLRLRRQWA